MKKILLVEDNAFIRENNAYILSVDNYEVLQAENGKEGVKTALSHIPDLIITDVMMPEMDGFEMVHELKLHPETAQIPVVFLTARASEADKSYAMSLGSVGYLIKPFNEKELLNLVGNLFGKHFYRHS